MLFHPVKPPSQTTIASYTGWLHIATSSELRVDLLLSGEVGYIPHRIHSDLRDEANHQVGSMNCPEQVRTPRMHTGLQQPPIQYNPFISQRINLYHIMLSICATQTDKSGKCTRVKYYRACSDFRALLRLEPFSNSFVMHYMKPLIHRTKLLK